MLESMNRRFLVGNLKYLKTILKMNLYVEKLLWNPEEQNLVGTFSAELKFPETEGIP